MKTLIYSCKSRLFFFSLFTAASIGFTGTSAAQERHGGNDGRRSERNNASVSSPRNINIERRNIDRNINRNVTPQNRIRENRNTTVERSVNTVNNRPNSFAQRNPATAARPVTTFSNRPRYGSISRPAYRPVYGYARPVYNARNPSWRYGFLPRRNSYFYSLPASYLTISFGGIGYRYWDGVFYMPYNNLFTVVAPPVGIYINVLPVGYRTVYVGNYPYYYYNGIYYDKGPDTTYHVVSPPVGAVVESLPQGYETVVIDGETYYTIDGAQYKPLVQQNGEIWYEVIKANK